MKISPEIHAVSRVLAIIAIFAAASAGAQTIPKTGVGLAGFSAYSSHYPFADCMKHASEWNDGQPTSGGADVSPQYLDSDGYLTQFSPGQNAAWCWLTYDNREYRGAGSGNRPDNPILTPAGEWVVTWDGVGAVHLVERNRTTSTPGDRVVLASGSDEMGRKVYKIAAGTELMVVMTAIGDPYPTNIRVWLPGQEGNLFNSPWLNDLKKADGSARFEVLRFMDWGMTNRSTAQLWPAHRKMRSYRTYSKDLGNPGGVPYEVMLDLCNTLGCHMWVCVPERADDNYVSKLANLIRYGDDRGAAHQNDKQKLREDLLVLSEYSNEVWNGGFTAGGWVAANVPPPSTGNGTMYRFGKRSREIWQLMEAELGDARQVNVLGSQAGNSGVASAAAKGAEDQAAPAPAKFVEAIGITFYFGGELAHEVWKNNWHTTDNKEATFAALEAESSAVLTKIFGDNPYSDKGVARAWGVPLVAYEGNCHLIPKTAEQKNSEEFLKFYFEVYNDPRMGLLIRKMLERFDAEGVRAICAFVDTGAWSQWGCWGFKRRSGQSTPGWTQLIDWADSARAKKVSSNSAHSEPVLVEWR